MRIRKTSPNHFSRNKGTSVENTSSSVQDLSLRWTVKRCLALHVLSVIPILAVYYVTGPAMAMMVGGSIAALVFSFLSLVETKRGSFAVTPVSIYFYWQTFGLGIAAVYMGSQISEIGRAHV